LSVDPTDLEVMRGRLESVAQEMQIILLRSSYSTILTESLDATSALFDSQGRTMAQAVSIPIHLGVLAELGRRVAERFPSATARPGDLYAINDPYAGGTHLPDIAVFAPAFSGDRLVGYVATMSHHADVGGSAPGSCSAVGVYDHHAEGLRIPMLRLGAGGAIDESLMALITANSRAPSNMAGDLNAQVSACRVGVQRLGEVFAEWGDAKAGAVIEELFEYANRLTRREIEEIPDGDYSFTDCLDDDGSGPGAQPVPIKVTVQKRGSTLHFDFTGTGPQVRTAINNVIYSVRSVVYFVVRALVGDMAPNNDGCYRQVSLHIPEGTILNPRFPAPVNARGVSLRRVVDAVYGAMAQALPERFTAANCGQTSLVSIGTIDEQRRQVIGVLGGPFMGGMGARAGKDGIDCTDHDCSNAFNMPVEVSEAQLPLLIRRLELWADSGGPGRTRGGLGYHLDVEWRRGEGMASVKRERHRFAPWGVFGGYPGPLGATQFASAGGDPAPIAPKSQVPLAPGDRLLFWTTGSGGYGSPLQRDPQLVLNDLLDGRITATAALEQYRVEIRDGAVDELATAKLRAAG
jgi:N-methylhydantoinase B/oxoprolinase/acetone carboxylase alpha subunit